MSTFISAPLSKNSHYFFSSAKDVVAIIAFQSFKEIEYSFLVSSKLISLSLNILKKHSFFKQNMLTCISGVDLLNGGYRFMISYELLSLCFNSRLRVKTFINSSNYLETSTSVFLNSNWWEREIWDLFGIFFKNHPDLRRILTDYGFEGYPLRKDFPICGFFEAIYNNNNKIISLELTSLSQDFRGLNYETNW
jgi:NADH:ubiquinone oxidoreductase subunit C